MDSRSDLDGREQQDLVRHAARLVRADLGLAALELAPLGIRVNAVRPGPVRTGPATPHLSAGDHSVQQHIASRPIARVGRPEDLGAAIRYLCCTDASWVTGQCFSVDGGTELAGAPTYLRSLMQG